LLSTCGLVTSANDSRLQARRLTSYNSSSKFRRRDLGSRHCDLTYAPARKTSTCSSWWNTQQDAL
jgi:hypothetical protein